jgi:superfamily I DNA/RNA helicase
MIEQANPKYRAVTVVGDIAQKLHHGNTIDLQACFPGRSVPHIRLTENLRQADMPGLALFSATFRSVLQRDEPPSMQLIKKAREQNSEIAHPKFAVCETNEALDNCIIETLTKATRHQTATVLFLDEKTAAQVFKRIERRLRENLIEAELSEKLNLARRHIRHFADVANAKGLEFDMVILAGVESYDLKNISHVNRMYVGITRARKSLLLISNNRLHTPELMKVTDLYHKLIRTS